MAKTSRAVVIGSGFGGLAAAVRLGARGYDVTVCEKLDKPGGRAYVYEQDGFVFDAGPTIVTAPFLLEELWELCGRKMADDIDLRAINPFYRIRFDDGSHFDYSGDDEAMKAEIARFNPDDVEGYERFLKASSMLYDIGFDQLLTESFDSFGKMTRVLPRLLRSQFYRSVHSLVARYIEHPKLKMVFSFHPLLVGGNPFTTTAVYALIAQLERRHGVHFAMGGTGSLVKGLVKLIESQGNTIRCNTPVKQIRVENGRAVGVELESGITLDADVVVSNADSAATYRYLVPEADSKRWNARKLARSRYSMSLFVWYFGTDRRYEDVPHHMIMLGPRYKALLEDIFDSKHLADDFSLYLHRPTATDPSLAPAGCDTFYVLSPVPNLDGDTDWEHTAEIYRQRIAAALEETVLPDLEKHTVSSRLLTPIDFRDRLFSYKGAAFGLQPILTQTAWFRPHNRSEDVEGLYLVGAGTHPGAGLPGVISSAKVLDEVVPDPAG
ncbi:MAG: phytoene desaturase [Woeseiaceae bacterium]|jgi:phytoene desaturase|nr:phytoene desaturase [Woeseiaceae bacterium]